MTIPAFPLSWPVGWKRTPAARRTRAKFSKQTITTHQFGNSSSSWKGKREISIAEATARVRAELARMGIDDNDLVISSNLALRQDGLPRSGQRDPDDPGVAVYWTDRFHPSVPPKCMAVDRYDRVADNLAAVAATLDAMRAIERHGGAEVLNRAFDGFASLPGPAAGQRMHWSVVLGCAPDASMKDVRAAHQRARSAAHPDHGGTAAEFQAVNQAFSEACREHEVEA